MRRAIIALLIWTGTGVAYAQTRPLAAPASAPVAEGAVYPDVATLPVAPPVPLEATHEALAYPWLGWVRLEALLWWIKDGPLPTPLLTTGPNGAAGVAELGAPGTRVVLGAQPQDYGTFFGGRWNWGFWFNPEHSCGLEFDGFVLERRSALSNASDATGSSVLGRPFINAQTGREQVAFVSFPNRFAGSVAVALSDHLWGFETNLLGKVLSGGQPPCSRQFPWGAWQLELLAGLRYLDLREDLGIDQVSQVLPGGVASFVGQTVRSPGVLALQENFAARNHFYGAQVGGRLEWVNGPVFVNLLGKIALGGCHEVLHVSGETGLARSPTLPIALPTANGALLATSTNIGQQGAARFCVVPELGITLGYQWGQHVRLLTGYSLLYLSRVVRPGEQLDRTVNLTQVPIHPSFGPLVGPARPALPFVESSFWAQGLHFGCEFRF